MNGRITEIELYIKILEKNLLPIFSEITQTKTTGPFMKDGASVPHFENHSDLGGIRHPQRWVSQVTNSVKHLRTTLDHAM